ncbi:MAG TPA: TonB-dependent receptor [Bryobacteraceae bacterium]|nr:TonB-dependent receptor [Bryobacteraceae bacterium]
MNRHSLIGIVPIAVLVCVAHAQEFRGSISGTVTDASGGSVPGATVTAINTSTNVRLPTTATSTGSFTIPFVLPGNYRIAVEAAGFKTAIRESIDVEIQQRVRLDFELEPGVVTESITVSAETPLLDTADASLGEVVNRRQMIDLPQAGRNAYLQARIAPGIMPTDTRLFARVFDNGAVSNVSISGAPRRSNDLLLDGIPNADSTNTVAFVPTVEAVEEMKAQTNTYDAEFGRAAGGTINITVRSGTNQFHGSMLEFLRNDKLEANSFFNNRSGQPKPRQRYNQFGATAGGPVYIPKLYDGRNRTFIFGSWESIRQKDPEAILTTVPTLLERNGDFSQSFDASGRLLPVYNPLTTRPDRDRPGRFIRDPFPGNAIPASLQDPVARKLMSYYGEPNQPGARLTSVENFAWSGSSPDRYDSLLLRGDHNFTDRQRIFVRTSTSVRPRTGNNLFDNIASTPATSERISRGAALDYLNTLTSSLMLNLRYGFTRYGDSDDFQDFSIAELGMPASLAAAVSNAHFPDIGISGYEGLGDSGDSRTRQNVHSFQANMTRIGSSHNLKWGFDHRMYQANYQDTGNASGSFSFNPNFTRGPDPVSNTNTGHAVASFLMGTPSSGSIDNNVQPAFFNKYYGLYLQDDFRVTRSLTLNLGLRYEYETPRMERHDRMVRGFAYDTPSPIAIPGRQLLGGLQFAGAGGEPRYQWNPQRTNFAPRFGIAWQIDPRVVFRAGYGIFRAGASDFGGGTAASPGFSATTPMVTSLDGVTPVHRLSNPFPDGLLAPIGSSEGLRTLTGQSIAFVDVNGRVPYTQQFSAGFQVQTPGNFVIDASYSGSRGTGLSIGNVNINQLPVEELARGGALQQSVPNPFFGQFASGVLASANTTLGQLLRPYPHFNSVTTRNPTVGNSTYHAALLKVERRMANGLTFLASYTVSKLIDDVGAPQNNYNIRGERALSVFDRPQRLVVSGLYELPFGPGKALTGGSSPIVHRIIGGWQLNWISTFMSGAPLAVTSQVNTTGSLGGSQRPDSTGVSPALEGPNRSRLDRYFDTSQFRAAAPFTFGNLSRQLPDVRGPGLHNWDISLIKNTNIAETVRLQIRGEAFNAFNLPAFDNPATSFGASTFGRISAVQNRANPARQIMLGMKLLW